MKFMNFMKIVKIVKFMKIMKIVKIMKFMKIVKIVKFMKIVKIVKFKKLVKFIFCLFDNLKCLNNDLRECKKLQKLKNRVLKILLIISCDCKI